MKNPCLVRTEVKVYQMELAVRACARTDTLASSVRSPETPVVSRPRSRKGQNRMQSRLATRFQAYLKDRRPISASHLIMSPFLLCSARPMSRVQRRMLLCRSRGLTAAVAAIRTRGIYRILLLYWMNNRTQ